MHVACLAVFWVGVSAVAVWVAVALYALRMFAVTGFYHRYFSHKTFRTSRAVQFVFAQIGASSVQRGPLWWAAHDLGNEFFALLLSPDLMYSSALFARDDEATDGAALETASTRKIDRICDKLDLQPGDRVLEIGTGWGGFALHAARHYGCHVTTTTISREQHALAAQRVAAAGEGRPWLAMAFGAVGGPLAYLAAARMGMVAFAIPPKPALAAPAVAWAVAMPLLASCATRFARMASPPALESGVPSR